MNISGASSQLHAPARVEAGMRQARYRGVARAARCASPAASLCSNGESQSAALAARRGADGLSACRKGTGSWVCAAPRMFTC